MSFSRELIAAYFAHGATILYAIASTVIKDIGDIVTIIGVLGGLGTGLYFHLKDQARKSREEKREIQFHQLEARHKELQIKVMEDKIKEDQKPG